MAASVETISRQGSAPGSRLNTAAARDTYMSAVPGTIKYALEKQREKAASSSPKKRKADKSSVDSKGSRKSRRVRGVSPGGDIPEEEEEQGDAVGAAPDEIGQDL